MHGTEDFADVVQTKEQAKQKQGSHLVDIGADDAVALVTERARPWDTSQKKISGRKMSR